MPLKPVGAARDIQAITRTADNINDILGDRIKNAEIHLKAAGDMEETSDGRPAKGFWHLRNPDRQIWLLDAVGTYGVVKTLAHEAMHVLDDDWLNIGQQRAIMALMKPEPRFWNDKIINGETHKYTGLPFEAFAVYGSRAIGDLGFTRPAYRGIFDRKIADMAALRDILDDTTEDGVRGEGRRQDDDVITNEPSPADTLEEVQEQLDEAESRLGSAKSKASKIRRAINQGDLAFARSKAQEIEAL